jgi:hypothetical protein
MIRRFALLPALGLAAALVWAPLPFGSVMPRQEYWLHLWTAAVFLLALVSGERLAPLRAARGAGLALAAVALLGAVQARAWPAGAVAIVSPEHRQLSAEAAALAGAAAPAAVPLSLAPSTSRAAAASWLAAALALAAAAMAGRVRERRRYLLGALLGSALFQVIFGAQRWVVQARETWGVPVPSDPTRLRGTFVNPNHLAAFVGIGLPVAFAWAWWGLRRARHEPRSERRLLLVGVPVLVWLTLFAGLAFSRSRAGMLAAVAAAAVQGVLLAWSQRRWRWLAAGALALAAGVAAVAATGFAEGFGRFAGEGLRSGTRGEVYLASLALWRRFPWLGTGLGTFRDAFPLVQPPGLGDVAFWHADGDPVELLVTTGLVGLALVAAGGVSLVRRLGRVLRSGMRSEDSAAGLAALGVLVALAVHEAFDFGLTMPANALAAAIVCGAALTAERRAPLPAGQAAPPPAAARRRRE